MTLNLNLPPQARGPPLQISIRPDHTVEKLPPESKLGEEKTLLTAGLLKRGMRFQLNALLSLGHSKRNSLLGPADAFNSVTNM